MNTDPYLAVYVHDGSPVIVEPRYYCPNTLAMAMSTPPKVRAPKHKRRRGKKNR